MDLMKKTYFVISGASRGIGQMMAIKLSAKLKDDSVMVLLARNADGLASTKSQIAATNSAIQVQTFSIDLGKATAEILRGLLQNSLKSINADQVNDFERAFIIHNVGSVGDVSKKATDISDISVWSEYYHLNLFGVIALNNEFLRIFANVPSRLVVNLSSLCAIQPFPSMSMYCSGKAARDMYFRVLALEEEKANDKSLLVLNYAPGAIDTDMTVLIQKESMDPEVTAMFKQQRDDKSMLTTTKTTEKFIKILEEQKFQSGDHVDYWD